MVVRIFIMFIFLAGVVYGSEKFAVAYRPDIDLTKKAVEFDLDGDRLKIDISRPLNPFSKIKIIVSSEGFENYEIIATFNMKMDMGQFKTKLDYTGSYYEGEIILTKCIWGDKRWYVEFSFKKGDKAFTKVLLFDMVK